MAAQGRNPVCGPFAWTGAELAREGGWRQHWSPDEVAEIDKALRRAEQRGLLWDRLGRADFPLDAAARRLGAIGRELEQGRGFAVVSGFLVERYSAAQLRVIWMGLARHLGTPVYQDCEGQLLREIRDQGGDLGARHGHLKSGEDGGAFLSSKARTYGHGELRFHTDRADVVGLLAIRQAARGGFSRIASSVAVHNALLARRPELLELLYRPIHRSRLGEERGGENLVYGLPVFGLRDGKFTSHYSRTYIEAAQLRPGTPPLSEDQWQALDLLAELAAELSLEMRLEPGDMQWLNNHVIYHARGAFEDRPGKSSGRLLYRIWLSVPNNRPLPMDHAVLWRQVEAGGLRGGIGQDPPTPP
jgi:hypothetical protein